MCQITPSQSLRPLSVSLLPAWLSLVILGTLPPPSLYPTLAVWTHFCSGVPGPSLYIAFGVGVGSSCPLSRAPPLLQTTSPVLPIPAEILQANDNLTQVINLYKQLVRGEEVNGDATASSIPGKERAGVLWGASRVRGGMTFSVTTKVPRREQRHSVSSLKLLGRKPRTEEKGAKFVMK